MRKLYLRQNVLAPKVMVPNRQASKRSGGKRSRRQNVGAKTSASKLSILEIPVASCLPGSLINTIITKHNRVFAFIIRRGIRLPGTRLKWHEPGIFRGHRKYLSVYKLLMYMLILGQISLSNRK